MNRILDYEYYNRNSLVGQSVKNLMVVITFESLIYNTSYVHFFYFFILLLSPNIRIIRILYYKTNKTYLHFYTHTPTMLLCKKPFVNLMRFFILNYYYYNIKITQWPLLPEVLL